MLFCFIFIHFPISLSLSISLALALTLTQSLSPLSTHALNYLTRLPVSFFYKLNDVSSPRMERKLSLKCFTDAMFRAVKCFTPSSACMQRCQAARISSSTICSLFYVRFPPFSISTCLFVFRVSIRQRFVFRFLVSFVFLLLFLFEMTP